MPKVYYAVDNSVLHLHLAELSLKSLRRHNSRIAVDVFLYGTVKTSTARRFEKLGATIRRRPKLSDVKDTRSLEPFFQKWEALRHLEDERLLFVDADTWFLEDPARLFDLYSKKDFYAREEYGTRPGIGYQLLGNCVMEPQLHPKKLKAVSIMLGFKPQPIFNTGVMIFNHGFGMKAGEQIPEMNALARLFKKKPTYFPAQNWHLIEEVTSSIAFGKLPRFSYGKISKSVSPWYCEWKAEAVPTPGVVLHYWTKYSPFFARDFLSAAEARKLPFLIPVEKSYAEF